jgi:hypothetical protein
LLDGREGGRSLISFALAAIAVTGLFAVGPTWLSRVVVQQRTLTLYTSQDITLAAGIVEQFEAETGVRVQAVYDAETARTAGLANRLLGAEMPGSA